jgi:hypothetical protein
MNARTRGDDTHAPSRPAEGVSLLGEDALIGGMLPAARHQKSRSDSRSGVRPPAGGAHGDGPTTPVRSGLTLTPRRPSRRTLAHELGHVLLHTPDQVPRRGLMKAGGRGRVEVEVESVGLARRRGQWTEHLSHLFLYVGALAHEGNVKAMMRESATRALGTAHGTLGRLDPHKPEPAARTHTPTLRISHFPDAHPGRYRRPQPRGRSRRQHPAVSLLTQTEPV